MRKFNVLGIDQGIASCGFAVIEFKIYKNGKVKKTLKNHRVIKTTSKKYMGNRLGIIRSELEGAIDKYNPVIMGCEKLFFSPVRAGGRNKSASMMKTNFTTGVIYELSGAKGVPLETYVPGTIKKRVCGYGRATKEEVIEEISKVLGLDIENISEHEADAMGIALTAGDVYMSDMSEFGILAGKIKKGKNIK